MPPKPGALIVQTDLAATLRAIVKDGALAFYRGDVARKLALDMKSRGGLVTAADLARYATLWRQPLVGSYLGHAVVTSPLPSSGGTILLTILNALEAAPKDAPWHDASVLHLFLEASKRAFADRALMGDPAFVSDPTAELVKKVGPSGCGPASTLPSTSGRNGNAAGAQAGHARPGEPTHHPRLHGRRSQQPSLPRHHRQLLPSAREWWRREPASSGTTRWTTSPSLPACQRTTGCVGSSANAVAPGKRPLSSMAPTMVFEGPTAHGPLRRSSARRAARASPPSSPRPSSFTWPRALQWTRPSP